MHERVQESIPEPVWTLEKWARVGLVYVIAALFVVCLASGGGVKPCATTACLQARNMVPGFGTAAATTGTGGSYTLDEGYALAMKCAVYTRPEDEAACLASGGAGP